MVRCKGRGSAGVAGQPKMHRRFLLAWRGILAAVGPNRPLSSALLTCPGRQWLGPFPGKEFCLLQKWYAPKEFFSADWLCVRWRFPVTMQQWNKCLAH